MAVAKARVLEAIYLLSTGRSFRTHHARKMIQEGQSSCTTFARVCIGGNN
jgi:recombinational DNA repair ATPase RecF